MKQIDIKELRIYNPGGKVMVIRITNDDRAYIHGTTTYWDGKIFEKNLAIAVAAGCTVEEIAL